MTACSHLVGRTPVDKFFLKIVVIGVDISSAISHSTLGCRPSRPGDLFCTRFFSSFFTSSSFISMSLYGSVISSLSGMFGMLLRFSLVNTLKYFWFITSAISSSLVVYDPSLFFKLGIFNHRQYTYKHLTILCFCVCETAVDRVFEIATFPSAKILHSGSIKNDFFSF